MPSIAPFPSSHWEASVRNVARLCSNNRKHTSRDVIHMTESHVTAAEIQLNFCWMSTSEIQMSSGHLPKRSKGERVVWTRRQVWEPFHIMNMFGKKGRLKVYWEVVHPFQLVISKVSASWLHDSFWHRHPHTSIKFWHPDRPTLGSVFWWGCHCLFFSFAGHREHSKNVYF